MIDGRISQLTPATTPIVVQDLFEVSKYVGAGIYETKSFTGQDFLDFIGTSTLESVLSAGNTTGGTDILVSNGDVIENLTGGQLDLRYGDDGIVMLSNDGGDGASEYIELLSGATLVGSSGYIHLIAGGAIKLEGVGYLNLVTNGINATTVPYINDDKNLVSSLVTPTELGYLSGASSNIQNQINNINIGLNWKAASKVLCDSNVTISSPGASLDGVGMTAGDRVVLTAESLGKDNGVYVWNGAAVPMTRATDCATGGTGSTGVLGMTIVVEEGTYADQMWMCSTNATITIGVTTLTYIKTSATTYTGSDGVTLTGNNFTLNNSYFSGDVTCSAGALTIGASKVLYTMIAAMTSANLADIVSDETGSGALVFGTSPTLGYPSIVDTTDGTKKLKFLLSGSTTNKALTLVSAHTLDRSITFPDNSGILVTTESLLVVTNAMIAATTIDLAEKVTGVLPLANSQDVYFTISMFSAVLSPADGITYYMGQNFLAPSTTATNHAFVFPIGVNYKIIGAIITASQNTVSGTTENSVLQLRNVTQATSTSIGNFQTNGSTTVGISTTFTGLNIEITSTDSICAQLNSPTWATNPTALRYIIQFLCKRTS